MTAPYPITHQLTLGPPPKRGLWGMGRPIRPDVPQTRPHQVLVYKVDGELILDGGSLHADSDQVVAASHVSIVDLTLDVAVGVRLPVELGDGTELPLQIFFACTVTDPVRVVRENVEAEPLLEAYLRRHSKIFNIGLRYGMHQVSEARLDISAQVTSYAALTSPNIAGMTVRMTGVEAMTPDEVRDYERKRRDRERERGLLREEEEHKYQRAMEAEAARQRIEASKAEFNDAQRERVSSGITDARQATLAAHTVGELSAQQLSETLRADEAERLRRHDELAAEQRQREREDMQREYDLRLEQERALREIELERERAEREVEIERERAKREAEIERERAKREAEVERDRAIRAADLERERAERELERERMKQENEREKQLLQAQVDFFTVLAKQGQTDTMNLSQTVSGLIAKVTGLATAPAEQRAAVAAQTVEATPIDAAPADPAPYQADPPAGGTQESEQARETEHVRVREEDEH